jgi:hypothetical protein
MTANVRWFEHLSVVEKRILHGRLSDRFSSVTATKYCDSLQSHLNTGTSKEWSEARPSDNENSRYRE